MSRKYSAAVTAVNVSTVPQDLFEIKSPASKVIKIHECRISQDGSAVSSQVRLRVSKLTATVTDGSGGSTPAAVAAEDGDSASAATVKANSTTQATTTGSKATWLSDAFNVLSGWLWLPAPEDQLVLSPNDACVVEVLAGSLANADATIVWEEIG